MYHFQKVGNTDETIASLAWWSHKVVECWNCFQFSYGNAKCSYFLSGAKPPPLFLLSRLRDGYPFDEMRVCCCIALLWLKGNYIESLELALLCTANQAFKTSLYSLSQSYALQHWKKKTSSSWSKFQFLFSAKPLLCTYVILLKIIFVGAERNPTNLFHQWRFWNQHQTFSFYQIYLVDSKANM